MAAAPATIRGNGRSRKKMPMKAAPATPMRRRVFSERRPIRNSASTTITSTAALIPNSAPSTAGTPRPSA
jgi:hypothetical protein